MFREKRLFRTCGKEKAHFDQGISGGTKRLS